jgi:glutamine amidotransferase
VRYFPPDIGLKVPHMGWNTLKAVSGSFVSSSGVDGMQTYFVHSLYSECADSNDIAAWTDYGLQFAAAVQRKNVWGMQFHPEKSGEVGMSLLREFLA